MRTYGDSFVGELDLTSIEGIGRSSSYPRLDELAAAVEAAGFKVPRFIREFGVYDSDVNIQFHVHSVSFHILGNDRLRMVRTSSTYGCSGILASHCCFMIKSFG
jgi:hypothetical protein